MSMDFSLREAKARLSHLLDLAASGTEIEIRRGGSKHDRFRIVPVETAEPLRKPGALAGRIAIPDGFDDEDPDVMALFDAR